MRKAVAVDANLLVLLVVGGTSQNYISRHKRCREFTKNDYGILYEFLSNFSKVIATPNILTETSNLLSHINEPARTEIFCAYRVFITGIEETIVSSQRASHRQEFLRLGLSDAALLELADRDIILLTRDSDLYLAALASGREAINFAHIQNGRDY